MSCSAGSSAQRHRRWQPLLVSASSGPVPPDAPRALAEEARTVLGLPHAASTRDVASAFRRMALLKHPDRPGGSGEEFARLHSAYVHAMVNSSSSDGAQAACEARSVHPEQQQACSASCVGVDWNTHDCMLQLRAWEQYQAGQQCLSCGDAKSAIDGLSAAIRDLVALNGCSDMLVNCLHARATAHLLLGQEPEHEADLEWAATVEHTA